MVFEVDKYIIATMPIVSEGGGFGILSSPRSVDQAYMHRPVKVKHVGIAHLVVEGYSDKETIIPFYEAEQRAFIPADEYLVGMVNKDKEAQ